MPKHYYIIPYLNTTLRYCATPTQCDTVPLLYDFKLEAAFACVSPLACTVKPSILHPLVHEVEIALDKTLDCEGHAAALRHTF